MLSPSQQFGRFRIEAKLGEGGAGIVYRAFDTESERTVALKVLRPDFAADPDRRARFTQEAKAAASLSHPHIVTIHEVGTEQGLDFICMEHLEGETLDQRIRRRALSDAEVLQCARAIADAAAAAHRAGIVHRDLKPANIFITAAGGVKLLDFGLAKLTESNLTELTATRTMYSVEGQIVGTVLYMSPEQAEGRPVDARSDIFSFGAVLYEMMTGKAAFERESNLATMAAILRETPAPIREARPGVADGLTELVAHCLEKTPGRRFASMDEVVSALASESIVRGGGSRVRGRRWVATGKAIGALVGGYGIVWWAATWAPLASVYLFCLLVGFGLSVVAALSGSFHLHIHAGDHGGLPAPSGSAAVSGFNFGTAAAFVAWFGGAGYALVRYAALAFPLVYVTASAVGLAGAVLVYLFVSKVLLANDRPLHPADFELVGITGRLSSGIRDGGGTGEMIFSQHGARRAISARSSAGIAIPKGAQVVVVRHKGGIVYVNSTGK